ncbi:MAG: tetratricopeptide repeat protein [Gammaproteobacteria bacterium]|nr:tetratricopeptide repeat protein [Gammaproteobacteria bacterium]
MFEKIVHTIKSVLRPVVLFSIVAVGGISMVNVAHGVEGAELRTMLTTGAYTKALELISTLPSEQQQNLDIRFFRATALAGEGQNAKAIVAFEQLIKDEPQYPEFYNNLAMLLVEEGKLLEAQQALEQGLRSRENYAMLYNNLTVVFETMARRSYAKALRIDKQHSPVLSPLVELRDFSPPERQPPVVIAAVEPMQSQVVEAEMVSEPVVMVEQEVVAQPSDDRSADDPQAESALRQWIEHWQNKDLSGYINSYSPNFKSRGYNSREAWVKGRSERIRRAEKIDISIEKINIDILSTERVQADFIMNYRSDRYSDRSKKRVVLKLIEGRWRIVRELTLKVLS